MHPLLVQVRAVARKARRLVMLYASARLFTIVVTAMLILGSVDYAVRYRDRAPRLISLLLVLGLAGWAVKRWLLPALRYRPDEIETAQRIELWFPQLRGRLASAIEFLSPANPAAVSGSANLQQHAIRMANQVATQLDLKSCLEFRSTRNSVVLAIAVASAVLMVVIADSSSVLRAAQRLALPWQETPWPRRHQLDLAEFPRSLATGQAFTVEVIDRRWRLPDTVTIFYRFDDSNDIRSHEVRRIENRVTDRLESVSQSFQIRAVGGDDDSMPWQSIVVRESPRVVELNLQLTAPAYTGLPPVRANSPIRAIVGTRVDVQGKSDRPLQAVKVETDTTVTTAPQLQLMEDRVQFSLDPSSNWILEQTGRFEFQLVDDDGIVGGSETADMQVLEDQPPQLTWENTRQTIAVTPIAVLQLQATVRDDLALQAVDLHVRPVNGPDESAAVRSLYRGTAIPEPREFPRTDGGDLIRIEDRWDLSQVDELKPGDALEIKLVAADYKPNSTESLVLRVDIISPEVLARQLTQRQSGLLAKLQDALRLQREVQSRSERLTQEIVAGQSSEATSDLAKGVLHSQHRVRELLSGDSDSVQSQVSSLLNELIRNQLEKSSNYSRLTEIEEVLSILNAQPLPRAEQSLSAVQSHLNDLSADGRKLAADELGTAIEVQQTIVSRLEDLLSRLTEWESLQRFAAEAYRLEQTQQQISERTGELLESGQSFRRMEELSETERAAIQELSRRQFDNGRELERLLSRIEESLPAHVQQQDHLATRALTDALNIAQRGEISTRMRDSGQDLERNRLGEAVASQSDVRAPLHDLSLALSQQAEHDLNRVAEALGNASRELTELRQRQQELGKRFGKVANDPTSQTEAEGRLAAMEQAKIAQSLDRLKEQFARLASPSTAEHLQEGANQAKQASAAAQENDLTTATENAEQASQALSDAERSLANDLQIAKQQQAAHLASKLAQSVADWLRQQQDLRDQTKIATEAGNSEEESHGIFQQAAQRQRLLASEIEQASATEFKELAFALALRTASDHMLRAGDSLSQQDGLRAETHQTNAIQYLTLIEDALRTGKARNLPSETSPSEQPQQQQQETSPSRSLAELQLLRLWQISIRQRTMELDTIQKNAGALTDEQLTELDELGQQQGQLADLVTKLVQSRSEVENVQRE